MEKLLEGFLDLNKIWFGLIFVGSVLNAIAKEITFFIGVPYITLVCFFIGGSGGKDGAMQSHLLKYKYGMHPLTVTWSPHLYTDIGWKNFQNWLHVGGFDNFLYTPNGKMHRLLTRNATLNLLSGS